MSLAQRRICQLSVIALAAIAILTLAGGAWANPSYHDQLGSPPVTLDGLSDVSYPGGTTWNGSGTSQSSSAISTIEADVTFRELCNGSWSNRGGGLDSNDNATDAHITSGNITHFINCSGLHQCETDTSHFFFQSGQFGSSPVTDDETTTC